LVVDVEIRLILTPATAPRDKILIRAANRKQLAEMIFLTVDLNRAAPHTKTAKNGYPLVGGLASRTSWSACPVPGTLAQSLPRPLTQSLRALVATSAPRSSDRSTKTARDLSAPPRVPSLSPPRERSRVSWFPRRRVSSQPSPPAEDVPLGASCEAARAEKPGPCSPDLDPKYCVDVDGLCEGPVLRGISARRAARRVLGAR